MAPKVLACAVPSEDSACSTTTSYGRGLELSSASHSIAKKTRHPIIRVVHVFAPKLIKTNAANFRALVQKLTGNHASDDDDEEEEEEVISHNHQANHSIKQEISHQKTPELRHQQKINHSDNHCYHQKEINHNDNHGYNQEIDNSKALESRYQKEIINQSFSHGYCTTRINTQLQQIDENRPLLGQHYAEFMQTARLPSDEVGLARIDKRNGYYHANHAGLERSKEGMHYVPAKSGTDDGYNYSSPSSLDQYSSSTGGSSFNEKGSSSSVLMEELDIIMGSFNSSYPFINHDDHHLPPHLMSTLDLKSWF